MKLYHFAATLALVLVLAAASFGQTEKGDYVVSVASEGYRLGDGTGERIHTEVITFTKTFDTAPTVMISITGLDATPGEKNPAVRMAVTAEKVTRAGFVLKFKTWGDSKVGAIWGSWIALGK